MNEYAFVEDDQTGTRPLQMPDLKQDNRGIWWPKYDDPEKLYRYMIKRVTDIDEAVVFCRSTSTCVQAGGHVGIWARRLAKYFEHVEVFEPTYDMHAACVLNTAHLRGVFVHREALGPETGELTMEVLPSGRSCVDTVSNGKGSDVELAPERVSVRTIDSLDLPRCDAIFLDVERYELKVLDGAAQTIAKFNPVITLEVLPGQNEEYDRYMQRIGYTFQKRVHNDQVYTRRKELER